MLIIRNDQMSAFQENLNLRFARKILPSVKESHPEAVAGKSDLEILQRLIVTIENAQSYGISENRDVTAFAELSFAFGEGFVHQPPFQQMLTESSVPANVRMDQILLALNPATQGLVSSAALNREVQGEVH